jgi:hypothetical protein
MNHGEGSADYVARRSRHLPSCDAQKASAAKVLFDLSRRLRGFCSLPATPPSGIPSPGAGGLFGAETSFLGEGCNGFRGDQPSRLNRRES